VNKTKKPTDLAKVVGSRRRVDQATSTARGPTTPVQQRRRRQATIAVDDGACRRSMVEEGQFKGVPSSWRSIRYNGWLVKEENRAVVLGGDGCHERIPLPL
jgi:hypothetical protein